MTPYSRDLRRVLIDRARQYALEEKLPFYQSTGRSAVVMFRGHEGKHGNFIAASYAAILANPLWKQRLNKSHSQRDALPEAYRRTAMELDSCTSSDALLMNVFCYPAFLRSGAAELLGVAADAEPIFGCPGGVPLSGQQADATEIDMKLGAVNLEAKLTESDLTCYSREKIERCVGFADVFVRSLLPTKRDKHGDEVFGSYQLLRNVLAIVPETDRRLVVLLDARRPDLLHEWWTIYGAIRSDDLRRRCGFLFWQELASCAPKPLRSFLACKYGV